MPSTPGPVRFAYLGAMKCFADQRCGKCKVTFNLDIFPRKGTISEVFRYLETSRMPAYYQYVTWNPRQFKVMCRWCRGAEMGRAYAPRGMTYQEGLASRQAQIEAHRLEVKQRKLLRQKVLREHMRAAGLEAR